VVLTANAACAAALPALFWRCAVIVTPGIQAPPKQRLVVDQTGPELPKLPARYYLARPRRNSFFANTIVADASATKDLHMQVSITQHCASAHNTLMRVGALAPNDIQALLLKMHACL
jgi:hypothetical protein